MEYETAKRILEKTDEGHEVKLPSKLEGRVTELFMGGFMRMLDRRGLQFSLHLAQIKRSSGWVCDITYETKDFTINAHGVAKSAHVACDKARLAYNKRRVEVTKALKKAGKKVR